MQYHIFKEQYSNDYFKLLNLEGLYKHMDLFAKLGKPLEVTEVTIPSYSWEDEDERLQADILEKLYSLWFSHPATSQIVYWNLVDGYAHLWTQDREAIKASQGDMALGENVYHGGLLRFDMSPKPAYYRMKELLTERWHTEETLVADDLGAAEFRGFYGDYDVEITLDGRTQTRTVSLSKGKNNEFNICL
jgi:hypothetical protein